MRQLNKPFLNKLDLSSIFAFSFVFVGIAFLFMATPTSVSAQETTETETHPGEDIITNSQEQHINTENEFIDEESEIDDSGHNENTAQDEASGNEETIIDDEPQQDNATNEEVDEEEPTEANGEEADETEEVVENEGKTDDENALEQDESDADTESDAETDADLEKEQDETDLEVEEEMEEDDDADLEEVAKEKEEKATEKKSDSSKKPAKKSSTTTSLSATKNQELGKGSRDKRVVQLKKDLAKLGFAVPGNGTDLFGADTEKKVKEFQKYYGLKVTGTLNKETESKLKAQITTPFQIGKRHNDTLQLKRDLNKIGFGGITVTTLYSDFSAKRVKEFQKYYGLKVTGIADEITHGKIKAVANSSFQNGKRHNDTLQLKRNLNKIGFGGISVTTLYSDFTEKRVREFQKYYGLKVNGIVDDKTNNKIKAVANSSFQNGKRHNDTLQLKRNLNKIGFGGITVTTLYSDFTEKRVRELQKYFGLKENGIADEVTLKKINTVVNSPFQNGKRHNDTLQLKRNLNKIGFGGITVTTLYSDFTEKRVKEFQKSFGLKVSGIADEVTFAKITAEAAKAPAPNSKIVYLDAGHGGTDPGASGNGLKEKDLTLDIAKRTKKLLEAAGYTVIMSRTTDKYVSLSERTKHANQVKADIFVSIHINSGGGTGIETWMMQNGPESAKSKKLATSIQNETIKQTGVRDRGVKDGNLHVNRESKMPSALVEVGFIDTKADADKLKQASFKQKAAIGIANGIKNYFK